MTRLKNRKLLMILLVLLSGFIFVKKGILVGATGQELLIEDRANIPMKELSGLTTLDSSQAIKPYIAVGDRKAELITFSRSNNETRIIKRRDFSDLLLERFSLCSVFVGDLCLRQKEMLLSDWEGIATDPDKIFLLQEHSTAIIILSQTDDNYLKIINLDFSPFQKDTNKVKGILRKNSKLSEGILLLKNGHIIAAKEGDPMVLVEFAPHTSEAPALGLNAETLLEHGTSFQLPFEKSQSDRIKFKPISIWTFKGSSKCDISDLAVSPDNKRYYFMSQKCRTISEIAPLSPENSRVEILKSWSIPRKVHNPEGLLVDSNGDFVIVSDRKSSKKNNFFRLSRN